MAEVSKMKRTLGGNFLAKHSQHLDTLQSHTKLLKAQAAWYAKILGFLQSMIVAA